MSCYHCLLDIPGRDHTVCAFLSDLATMRDIPFAEAERQYQEGLLIDVTEARMTGDEMLEPATPTPLFVIGEEGRALQRERGDDAEIAPARLDRLGFRHWRRQ